MTVAADTKSGAEPLVRIDGLTKVFPVGPRRFGRTQRSGLTAVDDVSIDVHKGELVGLVGESGCGKSTLGRLVLRLVEPTKGRIFFSGTEVTRLQPRQMRGFRRHMQIVFQDPLASLNPRMVVRDLIGESLRVHGIARSRKEINARVTDLLHEVGLGPEHLLRYPHEFSGGQRQRVCIARALAPRPSFIVADEPLSQLDVSVQAQIVNLLLSLRDELGLAFLFISHDLNLVGLLADRVAVMYLGQLVEVGAARTVYDEPLHPYTRALLESIPVADPSRRDRQRPLLGGEAPSALQPPPGCPFNPRCSMLVSRCLEERPGLREVTPGRLVACHEV